MGHNDHIDFDLHNHLTATIESGFLDEIAHKNAIGVARQVIHRGLDSLSPKQRTVYENVIIPALKSARDEFNMQEIFNRNPD